MLQRREDAGYYNDDAEELLDLLKLEACIIAACWSGTEDCNIPLTRAVMAVHGHPKPWSTILRALMSGDLPFGLRQEGATLVSRVLVSRASLDAISTMRDSYAEEAAARVMAAAAAAAAQLEALRNTRLTFSSKRRSSAKQTSHVDKKRRTAETSSRRGIEAAEKRLRKLLGEVVVRCMSARKDDLERSVFKKHARELTNIIVEKEKKNPKMWPPSSESISSYLKDGLSTEKKTKVKAFAKEYVNKLVAHKTGKSKETSKDSDALASSTRDSVSPRESDHQDEDDDDDDDDNDASSTHPSDAGGGQEEDGDRSLTSVSPTTSSAANTNRTSL